MQPFYAKMNVDLGGNRSFNQTPKPGFLFRERRQELQKSLVLQENGNNAAPVRRCSLNEILMPK
jgi:hypothetical protein